MSISFSKCYSKTMTSLPTGTYLFGRYGFDQTLAPQLSLRDGEKLLSVQPVGQQITLTFDKAQRYCTGWHDLRSREDFACPDRARLPAAYAQCRHCQVKTGFNPAFYHAKTISEQQTTRNQQPHLLYLAHFAPGVV